MPKGRGKGIRGLVFKHGLLFEDRREGKVIRILGFRLKPAPGVIILILLRFGDAIGGAKGPPHYRRPSYGEDESQIAIR